MAILELNLRANLELKHMFILCSQYVHSMVISIRGNDKSLNEIELATFVMKHVYRFLCIQNIMTCLSHPTDKYLFNVKSRNTILICCYGQSQQ